MQAASSHPCPLGLPSAILRPLREAGGQSKGGQSEASRSQASVPFRTLDGQHGRGQTLEAGQGDFYTVNFAHFPRLTGQTPLPGPPAPRFGILVEWCQGARPLGHQARGGNQAP